MKPFEIHSANVLGARKPSLALRDTTDYRSKFVASPASRWLSSYACEGLRLGKEGLPCIPFANTCHCMRAHMLMRLSTQRAGLLKGSALRVLHILV